MFDYSDITLEDLDDTDFDKRSEEDIEIEEDQMGQYYLLMDSYRT